MDGNWECRNLAKWNGHYLSIYFMVYALDAFGGVRGVQTGLLTSLAKYESRMGCLELAHQCLVDCISQGGYASVVFQEGHELPNLVLHPLGKLAVRCPPVCRDPPPVGARACAL